MKATKMNMKSRLLYDDFRDSDEKSDGLYLGNDRELVERQESHRGESKGDDRGQPFMARVR